MEKADEVLQTNTRLQRSKALPSVQLCCLTHASLDFGHPHTDTAKCAAVSILFIQVENKKMTKIV